MRRCTMFPRQPLDFVSYEKYERRMRFIEDFQFQQDVRRHNLGGAA